MQESMIEQNIVITEPSKNLRALGRNALVGKWKDAIIAVIIFIVCMEVPPLVFNSLFGVNIGNILASDGYTYGMDVGLYTDMYNSMPSYSALSTIYILLVTGPFSLGLTMFFLAMFRRHQVRPVDMFLGFERFGKALGLFLFQSLFVFLWTMLFIVPGIIASIRYSQAFYVLADDPTKSIRQCMNESKTMMKGNKAKYFCLSLSFIGWIILSSLPSSILQSIGGIVSSNDFVISLFAIVGYLFVAPVTAYMLSTQAGFYEILSGHLIKETQPAPIDPAMIEAVVPVASTSEEKPIEESIEGTIEENEGNIEAEVDDAKAAGELAGEAAADAVEDVEAFAEDAEEEIEETAEEFVDTAEEVEETMEDVEEEIEEEAEEDEQSGAL